MLFRGLPYLLVLARLINSRYYGTVFCTEQVGRSLYFNSPLFLYLVFLFGASFKSELIDLLFPVEERKKISILESKRREHLPKYAKTETQEVYRTIVEKLEVGLVEPPSLRYVRKLTNPWSIGVFLVFPIIFYVILFLGNFIPFSPDLYLLFLAFGVILSIIASILFASRRYEVKAPKYSEIKL